MEATGQREADQVSLTAVKTIITLAILLISFNLFSQSKTTPFLSGERMNYTMYFNWHFVWVKSGEVHFVCNSIQKDGLDFWNFKANGNTFKAYDLIYPVRDTFESVCLTNFEPGFFSRKVNHGKSYSSHTYTCDLETQRIFSEVYRPSGQQITDTIIYEKGAIDLLANAYFLRTLDINQLGQGQKVPAKMLVDNKVEDFFFRYMGKEVIKTRNGRSFRCHKFSIFLEEGDFFPKGEYMKVWLSDDQNKIPVMVDFKLFVGSVKAVLVSAQNTKGTLSSEIFKN